MRYPVQLRTSQSTDGDTSRVLGKLEHNGNDIPIVRVVANWDAGFRPFVLMADALLHRGTLPPRRRELVVLHIAARLGLDYEWHEHVAISVAAGVTEDQRAALHSGAVPLPSDGFSAQDVTAIDFADRLLDPENELDQSTWDSVCAVLGEAESREIVFAVAWWAGFVPVIARSLVPLALAAETEGAEVGQLLDEDTEP